MANWTSLKTAITSAIRENGTQEITGAHLQSVLLSITEALGQNRTFAGVALPNTIPATPDGPIFYIAAGPGIYKYFKLQVEKNLALFVNTENSWELKTIKLDPFSPIVIVDKTLSELNNVNDSGFYQLTDNSGKALGFLINIVDSSIGLCQQYVFGNFEITPDGLIQKSTSPQNIYTSILTRSISAGSDNGKNWTLASVIKKYPAFDLSILLNAAQKGETISGSAVLQMFIPTGYTSNAGVIPSAGDILGGETANAYTVINSSIDSQSSVLNTSFSLDVLDTKNPSYLSISSLPEIDDPPLEIAGSKKCYSLQIITNKNFTIVHAIRVFEYSASLASATDISLTI